MQLILWWHEQLHMPKHDEAWHRQDLADELKELSEARGLIEHWSELSDIAYTYTRATWSGHQLARPIKFLPYYLGIVYMIPKYTSRWLFYRTLGKRLDPHAQLTEVRNPRKLHKLHGIANQYNLDPQKFEKEANDLLRYWPLLK
jgi:hypothetical protein